MISTKSLLTVSLFLLMTLLSTISYSNKLAPPPLQTEGQSAINGNAPKPNPAVCTSDDGNSKCDCALGCWGNATNCGCTQGKGIPVKLSNKENKVKVIDKLEGKATNKSEEKILNKVVDKSKDKIIIEATDKSKIKNVGKKEVSQSEYKIIKPEDNRATCSSSDGESTCECQGFCKAGATTCRCGIKMKELFEEPIQTLGK